MYNMLFPLCILTNSSLLMITVVTIHARSVMDVVKYYCFIYKKVVFLLFKCYNVFSLKVPLVPIKWQKWSYPKKCFDNLCKCSYKCFHSKMVWVGPLVLSFNQTCQGKYSTDIKKKKTPSKSWNIQFSETLFKMGFEALGKFDHFHWQQNYFYFFNANTKAEFSGKYQLRTSWTHHFSWP